MGALPPIIAKASHELSRLSTSLEQVVGGFRI
jgi:hypothetical protein